MAQSDGGLDELFSELSQDNFQNLSSFRMETNLIRANAGKEAINVEEALLYLKPCQFQCSKALEVYKNYQKSRETYQLDNLRPYREPLSLEIGSNKMEIVGTQDSDGFPIVLFTVSRHETFKSDHKADMQLLFYTLDQVSQCDAAKEKGIVFIIDLRDSQLSDIRYTNNVVSVLKDGYPIHTKEIYIVSTKGINKLIHVLQNWVKHDSKVKFIDFSELGSHFTPEQLPLSLGGTFVPRITSPVHNRSSVSVTKDDSAVVKAEPTPLYPRRGSDGSKTSRESERGQRPSPGGGKAVNKMLGLFESGHGTKSPPHSPASSSRPFPPPSPNRVRPIPPAKPTAAKKGVTQPTIQPLVKLQIHEGDVGKAKVPLLPPNGRSHIGKSNPADSPRQTGRVAASSREPMSASTKEKMGGSIGKESVSGEGSKGTSGAHVVQVAFDGDVKRKAQKMFSSNGESSSKDKQLSGRNTQVPKDTPSKLQNPQIKSPDRKRANSTDKGHSSPQKVPRVPVQHMMGNKKSSHIGSGPHSKGFSESTPGSLTPELRKNKSSNLEYENVELSRNPQPHSKPPSQDDGDYENMSFSNRDSDVYENVGIGFAGTGGDLAGPLPPLPPVKHPVRQSYENVEIGKQSPSRGRHKEKVKEVVEEDDDDMLFGKEGPPGMQEMIYENFGPDKGNKLMSIEQVSAHVEKLGKKGLSTEYYRIRNEPLTGLHKMCRLPANTPKNRYKDVICYDETRVLLRSLPGQDDSDYIHANYVDGFKKPKAFILTQGPKDKTVVDFWRMIWEQQVGVVVMVTRCVELGKRKCAQYWPESDSGSAQHGPFTVTVTSIQSKDGYDVRTLKFAFKGSERTLTHFQFLAWPDYGIPASGSSLLGLILAVREAQAKVSPHSAPVVVHCSAGVGRSGAFCTIDNAIHELDKLKKVNLQGIVRKMRKQRAFSVQTEEQYELCYKTLLEYAR